MHSKINNLIFIQLQQSTHRQFLTGRCSSKIAQIVLVNIKLPRGKNNKHKMLKYCQLLTENDYANSAEHNNAVTLKLCMISNYSYPNPNIQRYCIVLHSLSAIQFLILYRNHDAISSKMKMKQ